MVTVEGTLRGTPSRLHTDGLTFTHNASYATIDGSVRQRDSSAVGLDLTLSNSRLEPSDIREVWPELPLAPTFSPGPISLYASIQGTIQPRKPLLPFDLTTRLVAESSHGTVRGSLSVARSSSGPLTYQSSLDAKNLNLAPLTGNAAPSTRLTGHLEAQGTGLGRDTLRAEIGLSLAASQLAGRPVASADGQISLRTSQAQGTLSLRQKGTGRLFVQLSMDSLKPPFGYTAVLTGSNLNLAPLADPFPETTLNGRITLRAAGTRWSTLAGTAVVNVDSSRVYRGDSTVVLPPHSGTIQLAKRRSERPRLEISSAVAHVTVDGTSLGPPFWSMARTWEAALRNAVRRERNKRAPSHPLSSLSPPSPLSASSRPRTGRKKQRATPSPLSSSPIEAHAELRIHQPEILHSWWAAFPRRAKDVRAEATLSLSSDSLYASGRFSASLLRTGPREAEGLEVEYKLSGPMERPLAQSLRLTATASARRLALGGPALEGASFSINYDHRGGTVQVKADSVGIAQGVQIEGNLHITPTLNKLRLQTISFNINNTEWRNASPSSIYAFSNSLVVTPLTLRHPHPQTPSFQRVHVRGTLSAQPTDTLRVQAENVYLPPISRAIGTPHLVGGNLDGQLRLRSGWGTPHLIGNVSVQRLSYDRRLLGNARIRTEYSARSPDLTIQGSLGTTAASIDRLPGPDLVPEGARRIDPNRLSWSGRIRLPEWMRPSATQPSRVPEGETLDLSVQVERADLFFFRYIFEKQVTKIQGYATGPLHIGGRFQDPVFNADFSIVNGSVALPLFGLHYDVQGRIKVNRRGIHPRNIRVEGAKGTATVNGSILFNDYRYFSFDLSATLDGLTVIDVSEAENLPFYGHIRGSGPLTLQGPLSDATLRSNSARTTPDSELYIPVSGETVENDTGFIVFADSTGEAPAVREFTRRENILAERPEGVPTFVEGLNLDLNVTAPNESTVHLVFDPVVGDVVTVVGSGRVQLQRKEGDFTVYGNFTATEGTYLFTAGEVFVRRFNITGGTITWDGDPTNAKLDLNAEYRTRASPSGLPGYENYRGRIPVTVNLHITGRVSTPQVDLGLSLTRDQRNNLVGSESLDAILNQPARTTEYATSVLLTNTFLLTTESITRSTGAEGAPSQRLTTAGNQLAFNSVSQLVSSQLNRFLGQALPNVDLNFGVQGEDPNNLDLIYGVALRLLNERLIIRGEGVYTGDDPDARQAQGPQGEFVVEVRLSSRFSAEVFYRRRGDELTRNRALTSSRGAGLTYQTQFSSWKTLFHRLFGWLLPGSSSPSEQPRPNPVADPPTIPADSTRAASGQP
ncbi:MAG: translocation/assembly module TamB domain-containing protein [Salinibacter sp.]